VAWAPERTYHPAWSADQAGTFRDRWRHLAATVADHKDRR